MVTIVSATNRIGNNTEKFAQKCKELLKEKGIESRILDLSEITQEISLPSIYNQENPLFSELSKSYVQKVDKFLFVIPEYNGSFPGILKLMIDAIKPSEFYGKKAALIGVAAGRAGNLRGMDHFADILNYIQVTVMPQKLPISSIDGLMNDGEIVDEDTIQNLGLQMDKFIAF